MVFTVSLPDAMDSLATPSPSLDCARVFPDRAARMFRHRMSGVSADLRLPLTRRRAFVKCRTTRLRTGLSQVIVDLQAHSRLPKARLRYLSQPSLRPNRGDIHS